MCELEKHLVWFRNTIHARYTTATYYKITAGTLVSSSVKGDIAIQWEWSKFDPSQNPNPLTDYDKTLQNWLSPRDEHVTQNLSQSAVRERLAKYVKYKASLFYFYFYRTRLLKLSGYGFWRTMAQSTHCNVRQCLLWGPHDGRQHFWVQIPKKPSKWPSIGTFELPRTASRRITS